MLKSLYIESLFGLYTYDLNFTNQEDVAIKFITGPNGYGKTTILSLIYSMYSCDFDSLMKIPFQCLTFNFGNDIVEVHQNRLFKTEEDTSDEEHLSEIALSIIFRKNADNSIIEQFDIKSGDTSHQKEAGQNLKLYFKALPCYYIKDQRLLHKSASLNDEITKSQSGSVSAVMDNAEDLKQKLKLEANSLNEDLQLSKLTFKGSVEETEYNERKDKINATIMKWRKYGLIDELTVKDYDPGNAVFLNAFLTAIEAAAKRSQPFIALLDAFSEIVEKSQFVNKKMQINPRYGYRFIAEDEVRSILSASNLSSGEQHILIQTYELLFKAQEDSLVLIDEPELSFHLVWQMDYLSNLKSIVKLRQIQCIVSTHSPQVFSSNWNLSVDLFTQSSANHD